MSKEKSKTKQKINRLKIKPIDKLKKKLSKSKLKLKNLNLPKISRRKIKKSNFVKSLSNPIISPRTENDWETRQTFNPGAALIEDKVYFLYRAIGEDGISRFGLAISKDGFEIEERLNEPIYEHSLENSFISPSLFSSGGSWGGGEDSRLTYIEEDKKLYMTYTACDGGLRVALTSIKIKDFLNKKKSQWKIPQLISANGEVHKNWVIFPEKIKGKYAILHSINPKITITYVKDLNFKKNQIIKSRYGGGKSNQKSWDSWVRGAGPPPLKTEKGWLLFYHAIDKKDPNKYKIGAMILDLEKPTKILYRSQWPVLEPDEAYENEGSKSGVVYASGAIIRNDQIIIYYGGADSYVCLASCNLNQFLESLIHKEKPVMKKVQLKNNILKKLKK